MKKIPSLKTVQVSKELRTILYNFHIPTHVVLKQCEKTHNQCSGRANAHEERMGGLAQPLHQRGYSL